MAMLGGEPKNTVGLVTRQPHFSINSNLTLKVTALSNRRFLGGRDFSRFLFWGSIFLKSSKVGLLGEISCEVRFLSGQIPARDKDRPTSDLDRGGHRGGSGALVTKMLSRYSRTWVL